MKMDSKLKTVFFLVALEILLCSIPSTESHGRFLKPAGRSSIWRDPQFQDENPPVNNNDDALRCGGVRQADNPGTQCGVCGDPEGDPIPRPNEFNGSLYRGIITGTYQSGQVIEVQGEVTINHNGFIEWRLCTDPNTETQNCFDQHLLQKADGTGSKVTVNGVGLYKVDLVLPTGVTCNHCVIQMNYRGGEVGDCGDGTSAAGCGPQQTYRGCSDVKIN